MNVPIGQCSPYLAYLLEKSKESDDTSKKIREMMMLMILYIIANQVSDAHPKIIDGKVVTDSSHQSKK